MNHVTRRTATYTDSQEPWLWSGSRTITFRELLLILRRRLWLAIIPVLFVLVPAILMIAGMKPHYTAQGTIVVKPVETAMNVMTDVQTLQTEMQILTSDRLARRAIGNLGLAELPEFNPAMATETSGILPFDLPSLPDWRALASPVAEMLGFAPLTAAEAPAAGAADVMEAEVLPNFQQRLMVAPLRESRVLTVQFRSESPTVAANVVNELSALYLTQQLESKMEAKDLATAWLRDRVTELRDRVAGLEHQIEEYRAGSGIIEARTASLVAEQISTVSTELISARAEAETAAARLREFERAMNERGPRAVLEMLGGASAGLLERDNGARQRLAEARGNYGDQHPTVVNRRAEVNELAGRIRSDAANAVSAARSEAEVAARRAATLAGSLNELQGELARMKNAEVEMRGMQRQAEADTALLAQYLEQLNAQERMAVEQPDAWVLSKAAVPSMPSGPNRKLLGVGTLVLVGALWLVMVVIAELLENGVMSTDEVKSSLNAVPLGLVPRVPGKLAGPAARARYVVDKPVSAFAESLRSIYTALQIEQQRTGDGKSVMITSSVPKEGKSTLVVSLARQVAAQGQRVLVIDADLRRPNVETLVGHRYLIDPKSHPLPEDNPLAPVVQEDSASGAHIVSASRLSAMLKEMNQAPYILRPNVLTSMLATVQQHYDLILIDTPPVVPVADARALAMVVDHCVFVVRWRKTAPRIVRFALDQLHDAGARVTGVVLSQVEAKRHALYGYGDSAVSHRTSYRYYTS
ncbi:GumC family protein [Azospirillum halopraeferens]|uniref:GumC family protein n=1 Tax=Azospirillum halopraeferens TaxID=34010 RepID=UPI0004103C07|nr:AAA family ATPase [Azospirillum halopraeferens]